MCLEEVASKRSVGSGGGGLRCMFLLPLIPRIWNIWSLISATFNGCFDSALIVGKRAFVACTHLINNTSDLVCCFVLSFEGGREGGRDGVGRGTEKCSREVMRADTEVCRRRG